MLSCTSSKNIELYKLHASLFWSSYAKEIFYLSPFEKSSSTIHLVARTCSYSPLSPSIYSVKYLAEDEWILDPVTIADIYEPLVCSFFILCTRNLPTVTSQRFFLYKHCKILFWSILLSSVSYFSCWESQAIFWVTISIMHYNLQSNDCMVSGDSTCSSLGN